MQHDSAQRRGPSRRAVIVGGAAVAVAAATAAPANGTGRTAATIARGYVFDDADATGVRLSGHAGIGGVMVSNGREVVLTERDGSWSLPVESGDSLFVIKPPNWTTPHDASGLPLYSYLHQPEGSPVGAPSLFAGVEPTGPLPTSIDFPLRRSAEAPRFEVLLMADTQPGNAEELSFVRDSILSRIPDAAPAFAIHHGDVMGDDLSLYDRYLRILGATGIPWHHCPGNHDMNLDSREPRFAFETWKRVFGATHYAFQQANATFILLNNVDRLDASNTDQAGRGYRGRIGERQLAFVENVLCHVPQDHLVVVSMHIPLVGFEDPTNPADSTCDRRRLLQRLARRPFTVSFAGHSHTTEHHYLGIEDGFERAAPHHHHVLTAACGSWWSGPRDQRGIPHSDSRDGSPKGFHVLSIDGNRYETRFVAANERTAGQMRLMLECARDAGDAARTGHRLLGCQISAEQRAEARIVVNVFDGGPRTKVVLELEGRARAEKMQRTDMRDPFVVEFFEQNRETCKPWASAARSSHIWTLQLPPDLSAGVYRIKASAIGEYGATQIGHLLLEIMA